MKIDRNGQIGGQPLKLVRDCLRQGQNGYISIEGVVDHLQQNWWHEFVDDLLERGVIRRNNRSSARRNLHWSREKTIYGVRAPAMPDFREPAQTLFDYLLAEGYIQPDDATRHRDKVWHQTTIKGEALKMTKLVARMNRAKAEALLKGVLERVAAINADPDMLHWVIEIRVVGSYLTDTDDLGDLDVALDHSDDQSLRARTSARLSIRSPQSTAKKTSHIWTTCTCLNG